MTPNSASSTLSASFIVLKRRHFHPLELRPSCCRDVSFVLNAVLHDAGMLASAESCLVVSQLVLA
jgi:hypothetical protein